MFYMSTVQSDINEKMRAILIDWLVDVHLKFKLLPETLFLTISIIDRFLSEAQINRQRLQLVGVASMFIACKYEEIYAPEVNDFVFVTDKAYTKEEVLDMEGNILKTLNFNLTFPTANRFLERYCFLLGFDEKNTHLARYLIELSLVEYKMLKYSPSMIAAAAVYLVNKIRRYEPWPQILERNAQYFEHNVRPGAKDLCLLLQNIEKCSLQAVRKKYSNPKFLEVAKIKIEKN